MSFREQFEAANRLWQENRFDEAEAAYLALLQEYPDSAPLLCRIGDVRRRKGDWALAEHYFKRAAERSSDLPWPYFGLGQLAEDSGEFARAVEFYRETLKRRPGLSVAMDAIQRTERFLVESGRQRRNESAPTFRELFAAANKLLEDRRFAEAEASYRALLKINPGSAALLCKVASIAAELGRGDEALALFDQAEALDPASPWPHVGRSELLTAGEDFAGAINALERGLALDSSLSFAERRIEGLRRRAGEEGKDRLVPEIRVWPATKPPGAQDDTKKRLRVVVAAWDLTHNPVGRGWLLADLASSFASCELVGPLFPAYGEDLWLPLRDSPRAFAVRGFTARTFATFVAGAIRLVAEKPCDIVWVSKPRLPSLLIGFLYKLMHGAHIVCDIDDDELAFVNADRALEIDEFLASSSPADWKEPFSIRWTQLAQSMIGSADVVTVCNPVLQEKHGGVLVRHARDERVFNPASIDRQAARAELGLTAADKVVLFLGTPRRHKGIIALADALNRIGDPSVVLCIIGSISDRSLKEELERFRMLRIVMRPDVPFARLPEFNAVADLVCILQDPDNSIAKSQTPAKLTDALAMGTPVLATVVEPIADLIGPGGIATVKDDDLVGALRTTLADVKSGRGYSELRRSFFLVELSYAANVKRAREALELSLLKRTPLPNGFVRLLHHIDAWMPGRLDLEMARHLKGTFPTGPRVGPLKSIDSGVNLVFFWKQNDSGLYGRRQEMLFAQLSRLPRIRRILHIDAPISVDQLEKMASPGNGRHGEGRLVVANTIERFLEARDENNIHRRTFIYRERNTSLLGRELPYKEAFPNFVEAWLRELDMLGNSLAWVCPVVPMFPEVQARIGFRFVVADVIDDQRQWPMAATWRAEIDKNYRQTFSVADVAIANCQTVADWLKEERLDPILVPNGMELHTDIHAWPVPPRLANMRRPIVGYSGNLNDRIDWTLIAGIADARPSWSIILIGSAPESSTFREIAARPNVHALGVLPYRQALHHIAAFDAAIIPHLRSKLSERMNPLKLYVYRSLGIPVVSTPVGNLDDLSNEICIAETLEAFLAGLEKAIDTMHHFGRSFPDPILMRALSWESRIKTIVNHLEQVFRSRAHATALEAVG